MNQSLMRVRAPSAVAAVLLLVSACSNAPDRISAKRNAGAGGGSAGSAGGITSTGGASGHAAGAGGKPAGTALDAGDETDAGEGP